MIVKKPVLKGHRLQILQTLATYPGVVFNNATWVPHQVVIQEMYKGKDRPEKNPDAVLRVSLHKLRRVIGRHAVLNDEVLGYALDPKFDPKPWLEATP